ncbi:hypothetical protein H6P81_016105 [Aristolochia fimbriata]|uniref:Uncharacterized protein n=1 Tax=Aristolochia fimbriata TaxID=158543 RepID=A0AAV7E7B2_ARIFI|nr:hypothetical protein H6P81_016105 [Aristolochia fimbriata]
MSFQRNFAATKETSRINQFKLTHYSDKKGWGAGAKEKYDEMFDAKERASQSGEVDEERIVADVLGYSAMKLISPSPDLNL